MIYQIHLIVQFEDRFSFPVLVVFEYLINCLFLQLTIIKIFAKQKILLQSKPLTILTVSLAMSLDNRIYLSPDHDRSELLVSHPLVLCVFHLLYYLLHVHQFLPEVFLEVVEVTLHRLHLFSLQTNEVFHVFVVLVIFEGLVILYPPSFLVPEEKRAGQGAINHHKEA